MWFDDDRHQVVGNAGTEIYLRSSTGQWTGIYTAQLLASPGFRFLSGSEAAQAASKPSGIGDMRAVFTALEAPQQQAAEQRAGHLREALTGFRSGDPDRPADGEPMERFDPRRNPRLAERLQAKADDLGISVATMWRDLQRYRADGVAGLMDGRGVTARDPLRHADPRILDAIFVQHTVGEAEDSTGTLSRFCRRVQTRLDAEYGPGAVKLPSRKTVARYLEILLPGRHTLGRAPSRRSEASRPQRTYNPNPAVRPGQVVMIDATPLDVIAYDPRGDVTHKVNLVAAIDVATRTLLAWRMTVGDTKAVDTVLLLNDAVTPEPLRPGWETRLRFTMLRLPIGRLLDVDERLEHAAARPVIWPEEILVDHAKVNLSDALRETCGLMGINLGLARLGNPTDKANIERAFETIRFDFSEHVAGYKGPDTAGRGRGVEHAARWSLEDLEEFFAEYAVGIYQRRTHSGLVMPGYPELELSPNEAYGLAVARYGYIACPPQSHHYCAQLPVQYRVIRPEGVQLDYLIYDDPVLGKYRRALSPTPGRGRQWPIRHHPNDPTRVFIHLEGVWQVLVWTHLPDTSIPFTWKMVEQARGLLLSAGVREPTQQQIAEELLALQQRMDAPEASNARSRRELVRARQDARTIRRDQERAGIPATDAPGLRLVPPIAESSAFALAELDDLEVWDPAAAREPR
ncbi:transposase [Catenulispora subtropica]|uniref:transposase n=1 Tax=Catenulispora subtropica TaxID=450798 RepID=UPI0031D5003C